MVDIKNTYSQQTLDSIYRFSSESDRVKYAVLKDRSIEVLPDFSSSFSSFVWFSSAKETVRTAVDRIVNEYPWDGTYYNYYHYLFSGSLFENYYTEIFPKYIGYGFFDDTLCMSASDNSGRIEPGSGSYSIEFWVNAAPRGVGEYSMIFGRGPGIGSFIVIMVGDPDGNGAKIDFYVNSGSSTAELYAKVNTDEWCYCGIVVDVENDRGYLYTGSITQQPVLAYSDTYSLSRMFMGDGLVYVGTGSFAYPGTFCLTGSLDEFRFWNKAISYDQILTYYNKDIRAQQNLQLYLKFNEPGDYSETVLRKVVDYSGWKSHMWTNLSSSLFRVSGSPMYNEEGTLLRHKDHSRVMQFTSSWTDRAETYDTYNNSLITKQLPGKFIEMDQNNNYVLTNFLYAYARQVDEIKLYIEQLKNINNITYDAYNRVPNQLIIDVLKNYGIKVSDPFMSATIAQRIFGQNIITSGSIGSGLTEVRNEILFRALNAFPLLVKTKGKPDILRTILNIYGIDSDVIRLREYGYNTKSGIRDSYQEDRERTSYITIFDT